MIKPIATSTLRHNGADAFDNVRCYGQAYAVTYQRKPLGTLTPLSPEELAACLAAVNHVIASEPEPELLFNTVLHSAHTKLTHFLADESCNE